MLRYREAPSLTADNQHLDYKDPTTKPLSLLLGRITPIAPGNWAQDSSTGQLTASHSISAAGLAACAL